MAYTPTNWTTGDTITATKLNKIEQGIANAGSGGGGGSDFSGIGFFVVTTTNFPTSSNNCGWFKYIKKTGNTYSEVLPPISGHPTMMLYGNGTWAYRSDFPVPQIDGYYLAFSPNSGVTITSSSGGIATTPVTVGGSYANYIVTGDFTITLRGWS